MKKFFALLLIFSAATTLSLAQIITFDDQGHTDNQLLGNPYTIINNGETFSFSVSNGGAPISTDHRYETQEPSCSSTGLSTITSGSVSANTWTIETTSGNEIDLGTIKFNNFFGCFSFSYSLTLEGFKDNVSTGTQAFSVPGLNAIFTSNSNFDDVDKIVITSTDLTNLGIDDINWSLNALPVELVYFNAKKSENATVLDWSTASELNNEKFEIEHRTDESSFEKIGAINGNFTTSEVSNYSFRHEKPTNGNNYYRLKQIDFDGKFEYSNIASITFHPEIGEVGEIYPIPSKSGLVHLEYTSVNKNEMIVSVFDMSGKLMINLIQPISIGNNNLSFDFSELNSGIYFLKMQVDETLMSKKIIKE